MPGAAHEAAARNAKFAGQRGQGSDCTKPRAAILIALQTISPCNDRRRGLVIPGCQGADIVRRNPADVGGTFRWVGACRFHKSLEAQNVPFDKAPIETITS